LSVISKTIIMTLSHLKYPIIQAPIGGIATPQLAAAVSNAGGLGGLALSWSTPEDAKQKIEAVSALTDKPIYANFVLNFEPKALKQTLESDIRIIQFSWGMPSQQMIELIRSYNATLGIQVTGKESALRAISLGADYLICQGTQAGGHVQATKTLKKALKEVIKVTAQKVPVYASGGISSGKAIGKYLKLGASGVVMGSRFVASNESGAHKTYKENLVHSKSDDTVLTVCMNKGWDNATHRIVRNSTFKLWESDGCTTIGNRPGEYDIIGESLSKTPIERYDYNAPRAGVTGNIEAMTQYAGKSVDNIHSINSVETILKSIWNEHLQAPE
jgi:nitronate monooxygenase